MVVDYQAGCGSVRVRDVGDYSLRPKACVVSSIRTKALVTQANSSLVTAEEMLGVRGNGKGMKTAEPRSKRASVGGTAAPRTG